jgi:hypothetical protein
VLWTLALLLVAVLAAGEAMSSLYAGHQACFFNSAVPCPGGDDPAVARLTFAFLGVPAIWLLGVVAGSASWALRRNRRPGR